MTKGEEKSSQDQKERPLRKEAKGEKAAVEGVSNLFPNPRVKRIGFAPIGAHAQEKGYKTEAVLIRTTVAQINPNLKSSKIALTQGTALMESRIRGSWEWIAGDRARHAQAVMMESRIRGSWEWIAGDRALNAKRSHLK